MPIKTDAKLKDRSVLNTTIRTDILKAFKEYCKGNGYPLNLILDSFMEQFVNGEFVLKLTEGSNGKNKTVKYNKEVE